MINRLMLPLIVLAVSFTVSIFVWFQLIEQERTQIDRAISMQPKSIKNEIYVHVWDRIHPIERMAKRWGKSERPIAHWADDARLYIKHDPAYHAVLWADSTGMIQQQVLRRDSMDEGVQLLSWMQKKIPQTGLSDTPLISTTFDPSQGNTGKLMLQIAVPISEGKDRGSHIIGIFQASRLLGGFLNERIQQGYVIDIHDGVTDLFNSSGRVAYKLTDSQLNEWEKEITVKLAGRTWSIHVYPSSDLLMSMQSYLNNLLLAGGFFLSLLLAWTTYLVQSVRRDAEQLTSSNIQLHHEIEKRKNAKEDLRQEHALNQQLLAAIPSILIGVSREGRVTLWNNSAETIFGIDKAKAMGLHLFQLNIQWNWKTIDLGIAESRISGSSRIDNVIFQRPDGSEGILGLNVTAIHEKGINSGFLLLGADISERLKLEGHLQLAQKMEAVGELAAGIAHEINTPLQYVGDNIRFLKNSFDYMQTLCEHYHKLIHHCEEKAFALEIIEDLKKADEEADIEFIMEEAPSAIEQSLDGVAKASGIVSALKEFSHPGQKEKVLIDINGVLESTTTVARNEWKYVADLKMYLDKTLPLVKCLPEINQVFLNIIVNAAHAIGDKLGENSSEKGLITIQTSHTDRFVEIRISDTGSGIPQGHLSKVFEPFFTTKEVGKGTGQGLAISHNIIVEQHQGSLEVESEAGKETTFIIRIPVDQQEES